MRRLTGIFVALVAAAALTSVPGAASARGSELVDGSPPKGVWVALTGPSQITWAWDAVPGATGYRIAVSTSPTMSNPKFRTVTGRTAAFAGLASQTYYFAVVRALDTNSTSDPSMKVSARTGAVDRPRTAVQTGRDFVDVRWVPYVGADKYQVQSSTMASFAGNVESHVVTGRTYTFGIERDSYGYFRVRAIEVTSTGGIRAASQWSLVAKQYVPYHPV